MREGAIPILSFWASGLLQSSLEHHSLQQGFLPQYRGAYGVNMPSMAWCCGAADAVSGALNPPLGPTVLQGSIIALHASQQRVVPGADVPPGEAGAAGAEPQRAGRHAAPSGGLPAAPAVHRPLLQPLQAHPARPGVPHLPAARRPLRQPRPRGAPLADSCCFWQIQPCDADTWH